MKVAMVGPYPRPGKPISGGVERVIDTLLPALSRRVEMTLLVPGAREDETITKDGVEIRYLASQARVPGVLRYATTDARRVAAAVAEIKPDIVHLQGASGHGMFIDRPQIVTIHGIVHRDVLTARAGPFPLRWAASFLMREIERRTRRRANHILVINPYVETILPDVRKLSSTSIPNPVDPLFLAPLPDMERKGMLSVGRIGTRKDTRRVIDIVLAMSGSGQQFEIIGDADDPAYLASCREAVDRAGRSNRISFTGPLCAQAIRDRLDGAALLVMASRQETAPVAIAEAHARGVPVVAPQAFGIPSMIREGVDGLFLPDATIEEQAALVARALETRWDHEAIARHAWSTYGVEAIADRTLEAYRACLARAQERRA